MRSWDLDSGIWDLGFEALGPRSSGLNISGVGLGQGEVSRV